MPLPNPVTLKATLAVEPPGPVHGQTGAAAVHDPTTRTSARRAGRARPGSAALLVQGLAPKHVGCEGYAELFFCDSRPRSPPAIAPAWNAAAPTHSTGAMPSFRLLDLPGRSASLSLELEAPCGRSTRRAERTTRSMATRCPTEPCFGLTSACSRSGEISPCPWRGRLRTCPCPAPWASSPCSRRRPNRGAVGRVQARLAFQRLPERLAWSSAPRDHVFREVQPDDLDFSVIGSLCTSNPRASHMASIVVFSRRIWPSTVFSAIRAGIVDHRAASRPAQPAALQVRARAGWRIRRSRGWRRRAGERRP